MLTKKGKGKRNEKGHEYLNYIYSDSVSFNTLYHFMHYFISCQALHYIMSRATAC